MSVNVVYTTSAIAVGGPDGNTGTTDGGFEVKLARPKKLGGKGDGNNPEQLFASDYAACFLSSMQLLASQGEATVPANAEVMATVGFGPRSEGGLGIEIALEITLPGVARREAEALIEKAHQIQSKLRRSPPPPEGSVIQAIKTSAALREGNVHAVINERVRR